MKKEIYKLLQKLNKMQNREEERSNKLNKNMKIKFNQVNQNKL